MLSFSSNQYGFSEIITSINKKLQLLSYYKNLTFSMFKKEPKQEIKQLEKYLEDQIAFYNDLKDNIMSFPDYEQEFIGIQNAFTGKTTDEILKNMTTIENLKYNSYIESLNKELEEIQINSAFYKVVDSVKWPEPDKEESIITDEIKEESENASEDK